MGKLLRDLTGIEQIEDADVTYGMNVCAAVSVGEGASSVSCGVCVPCRVDADCGDIDVDQVAGQAFGPIGSVAAAILLDQVFGQNDHEVHMYCETIAGGYGVCAPCPGVVYACGVDAGSSGGIELRARHLRDRRGARRELRIVRGFRVRGRRLLLHDRVGRPVRERGGLVLRDELLTRS